MAEEVKMEPVEPMPVAGAEPPKMANPLGKPTITATLKPGARPPMASGNTVATLRPGLKLPPKPGATIGAVKTGATVGALRPGLKLPPKPGAAIGAVKTGATVGALRPGLKLPPKPGATVTALKPGLKLPPKPGATLSLKPGVKLPTRPVIHKPGQAATSTALPKPVVPVSKPVSVDAQGVGKLPTVEAQSIARTDAKVPEITPNPNAMEQLKSVTQKLKGITQEIPAQAVLHKTGIIADGSSEIQKEAAKHKTARISLSDAMGVAPVKDENAPMKTIRIKRPVDITGATRPSSPIARPATAPAATPAAAAPTAPAAVTPSQVETKIATPESAAPSSTITQRKTLKITRPGGMARPGGVMRPGATKFGAKRPGAATATSAVTKPAEGAAPKDGEVADIPDIPSTPAPLAPIAAKPNEGSSLAWTISALVQFAACAVMGALAWYLWENTQLPTFCGGLGWGA